jgi:PadR family transcriptional regulator PadR
MVLLAILRVGEDAYGVPISRALKESSRREVLLGSVYAALERLATKGLVASDLGEPTAERGGRAKRFFRVTGKGYEKRVRARRTLLNLWAGVPALERTASLDDRRVRGSASEASDGRASVQLVTIRGSGELDRPRAPRRPHRRRGIDGFGYASRARCYPMCNRSTRRISSSISPRANGFFSTPSHRPSASPPAIANKMQGTDRSRA